METIWLTPSFRGFSILECLYHNLDICSWNPTIPFRTPDTLLIYCLLILMDSNMVIQGEPISTYQIRICRGTEERQRISEAECPICRRRFEVAASPVWRNTTTRTSGEGFVSLNGKIRNAQAQDFVIQPLAKRPHGKHRWRREG